MTDVTKEREKNPADVANKKVGVAPVSDDTPVADGPCTVGIVAAVTAEAVEAKKEAKREAAKRFTERKAQEKQERIEKSSKLIEKLKKENLWDKIGAEYQEFLTKLATANPNSGAASNSTFNKMFGATPKVGDKVTLLQAFERTFKGQADIDRLVRTKWAEAGIEVKYTADTKDVFKSVYEIVKLPS